MTPQTYQAIQSHVDGVDHVASAMESKWGVGRLRLLVTQELRERFDNQRAKFSQAIWSHDLEAVTVHAPAMIRAWRALDREATECGCAPLDPIVWEGRAPDGRVVAVVRTAAEAHKVTADGRHTEVWTLDELIAVAMREGGEVVAEVMQMFPGARVEEVRTKTPVLDDDIGAMFQ